MLIFILEMEGIEDDGPGNEVGSEHSDDEDEYVMEEEEEARANDDDDELESLGDLVRRNMKHFSLKFLFSFRVTMAAC